MAKIIEHFKTRLVLGVGTSIFIVSCFMNATLDYDVSGYQLVSSQIVRALGQPMMGAVLSFASAAWLRYGTKIDSRKPLKTLSQFPIAT